MADRNLYYLHELSDYKVASGYPDVRGWEVKDADNHTIGKVDNLLVNKNTKRVVYLDVEVDESLVKDNDASLATPASDGVHQFINKDGEDHLIVPIGMVTLDEDNDEVHSHEINSNTFRSTKRFRKGALEDPETEMVIYRLYIQDADIDTNNTRNEDLYERKEFQHNKSYSNR